MRPLFDPRVLGPFVVAAACLAVFEARDVPAPVAVHARSFELPVPVVPAVAGRAEMFEVDPERSSVRFVLGTGAGERVFVCPGMHGRLVLGANDAAAELELQLDLATLTPLAGCTGPGCSLLDLLGPHRDGLVAFRAGLLSTATSPMPGVLRRTWVGTLRCGGHAVQQTIDAWQSRLPGRPLRLQAHGPVPVELLGLPRHGGLLSFVDHHDVTLGFDLAWRRLPAR